MEANKESPSAFKTPCKPANVKSPVSACGTPVTIPASPFMKKLGCGTGVSVYLMNRMGKHTHSPWAIKKISSKCANSQMTVYQKRLCEEAKILKDLHHPNIVGFRAFTTAKDGSKCLAMEYGGEQSLNDLIEKRREEGLQAFPVATIEKVSLHVARGLQYLHNEKKLLHGDMKSCNVVIKGDFESIKICDVGVSLPLDENMQVSDPKAHYIGTEPWKPKEALEDGVITDKADIFAYGLTLWEMMTLSVPHLEILDTEGDDDDDDGKITIIMISLMRMILMKMRIMRDWELGLLWMQPLSEGLIRGWWSSSVSVQRKTLIKDLLQLTLFRCWNQTPSFVTKAVTSL
ncbi:lymphokine-activated killer T-cell-originated protein kinase homolog isoform X1 [Sinocyclocheilus anshuiensis]|uniref:lymphokine-activated killer T-cell-originated protein kinase homolog isoform X1 n=1 Tax=Sinocyclocheilus anshuiensis TaxID=1608454 RepID=UPI0007B90EDF|nr:PREDICTED: lymphokine-activated killer T-cell-originated protein kinase homolog isoform X1 [Sinocyclocheilus anshuiensis]